MSIAFELNGKPVIVEVEAEIPILWALRDVLGPDWYQIWLRKGSVWGMHHSPEWRADSLLPDTAFRRDGAKDYHH